MIHTLWHIGIHPQRRTIGAHGYNRRPIQKPFERVLARWSWSITLEKVFKDRFRLQLTSRPHLTLLSTWHTWIPRTCSWCVQGRLLLWWLTSGRHRSEIIAWHWLGSEWPFLQGKASQEHQVSRLLCVVLHCYWILGRFLKSIGYGSGDKRVAPNACAL